MKQMTLKTRNRYTLTFSTFFLFFSLFTCAYFVYRMNSVIKGESFLNYGVLLKDASLFSPCYLAVALSCLFMALYIPAISFYIYARFEKTPSSEVAYLILFLLGCLPEFARLFIPLETVQKNLPSFLVIAGRALFWGRTLSVVSLFAASIFSSKSKGLETEQNIIVLLVFSLALANIVPVNTTKITPSFSIEIGWNNFVQLTYAVAIILTAASYAVNAALNENSLYIRMGIGIFCIEFGCFILNTSAVLAFSAVGAILLIVGTMRALSALHKLYT